MFSDIELDALKEIGNIGAGNAATALSLLLSNKIRMNVPKVAIIPFDDVSNSVGGPENLVAGIFMRITGDISGNILIVIPKEKACNLVNCLLKQKPGEYGFSEMEESALVEVGNIVASSYIVALSDFTRLSMKISVPSFAYDMAGAIFSFPLSLYGYMGDTAFLIETEFAEGIDDINFHFFLIPDDDSLKVLLKAIGVSSFD
ncbi:MAG TPA: chemotaxis protein CheC [Thermoanaerobacterales bacterium]|nr:chemotaxis protein CheC [Thermoanaerobacterales bacterium]